MSNIIVEKLYKSFTSGNEELSILSDLSFEIETNTKVILTGNSGSGKSTLLNLISGMDNITSGKIIVDNHNVHSLDENSLSLFRSQSIGLIFQFHYLLKDFTALENVMMPAFMTGVNKLDAVNRAKDLIREIGLENRMNHFPSQLSGGERQRIAVVRSLINDPGIILADEPTGNLDELNSKKVEELLFELVTNHGKTLFLVTHDMDLTKRGDIHLKLENGKLSSL
ncbi:MAG: lipoprotein-releasing system ATP-binding protein LolD [Bacteroidetes bacterium]|nr:MAG: lipoprotein-releasing system ATP-binding protein LolD [Bacteroidota bacterium]